ncbi:MAG: NAD(P)/FAD-dependent oxidoreductase [Bacilli bacterium]|jgi:glycerol-3-phosphate dehydrogenase|nr:NAD(P)/FAD-dependent oxidoreductase [Bacilli bacterium]MCH4210310.1 NAD(P)/FAD-dependent oxidoreductase [Bacilli bacterium]
MEDVIIIGAGAVGAFIARSLSVYELKVLVLDKENDVGDVTSMANSAIAHSGYDPEPGTKKAIFNVAGNKMMPTVCRELDVPYGKIGTMTIALEDSQLKTLEDLKLRAEKNGVEARLMSHDEVIKAEPNINPEVKGALLCPTGGIVNPFLLVARAFENAMDNGVKLALNEEVTGIESKKDGFVVKTKDNEYEAKVVINAAGLHSDDVAKMIEPISWSINPRKGEYYVLDHYAPGFVNHVLFPLPSSKGKGVLVTTTTSGDYLVGPSSEFVPSKDDVSTDVMTLEDVKAQAKSLVPNIPFNQQIRVYAGLRATPSTHDFIIEPAKSNSKFINVAGIESPGLVSSPAIGEYVADKLVGAVLPLKKKAHYETKVRPYVKPLTMPLEERNALIKEHPDYGMMVCQCEKVSLGEIKDVMSRSLPVYSVKALKKRTRAGFGKCQGGFCQPSIVRLLAEYYHTTPDKVNYDKLNSPLVVEEVKKEGK